MPLSTPSPKEKAVSVLHPMPLIYKAFHPYHFRQEKVSKFNINFTVKSVNDLLHSTSKLKKIIKQQTTLSINIKVGTTITENVTSMKILANIAFCCCKS